jgi:hypothetical protein
VWSASCRSRCSRLSRTLAAKERFFRCSCKLISSRPCRPLRTLWSSPAASCQRVQPDYCWKYHCTIPERWGLQWNSDERHCGFRSSAHQSPQTACYGVGQVATNPNALREFAPGIGQIYSLQNAANSSYNALQFSFRRTKAPLVLGVAYTYSHSIDDASDRSDASSVNSLNLPFARASSSFDQRHLLNVSYIYDLPPFSKWLYSCQAEEDDSAKAVCVTEENSAVSRFLFKGWQLSGVTTFQTGTPFTVINIGSPDGISTLDNAGVANGSGAGSYPDLCGDPHASLPFGGNNPESVGPLLLNPGAFCAPRGLTFGDAGRNVLRNPLRFNTDVALLKHWTVKEGSSVEFRMEVFNFFNNTQFRIYDPTLGNQANNTVNCYGGLGVGYSAAGGDGANCLTGSAFLHPVSAHRPAQGNLLLSGRFESACNPTGINRDQATPIPADSAMKQIGAIVAKNASANLIRGGATAMVALALPHFLTRSLDHDRFAAWSLLLQLSAYTTYLDFGVQTAVARFLAGYIERGDGKHRDRLVCTALALLCLAAVLAVVVIVVVLWQLPNLFHGISSELMPEFRLAAAILGASVVLALPFSAFSGVLLGLHRNEYVAAAVGGSRLLGAVGFCYWCGILIP